MKKNFFKKLSFVMALAMTVSVTAPAAGALAAAKPALTATKKYLHLDVEDKNEYNFNIKNKKSGWKYLWTSSNEDIVEVNKKNGVAEATGVGTAKVTCVISDKEGEEVAELKATVVVRDNIKEVKISNAADAAKLGVGVEFDFNRSFTTLSGSTKKTSAVTRWTVDKEGATINDSGVFKATEAGEYTVTARSFQSKEKYNLWVSDADEYADYVLATDTTKVVVAPSIASVKQVNLKKFAVTFDSAVTDVADKLTVHQVVAGTKVLDLISSVEMDADNKVATVELYTEMSGGATYVVEYPGMDVAEFVAAKTGVDEVAQIKVKTTQVEVYEPTKLEATFLDKNGVDISTSDLQNRVTYEASDEQVLVGDELTMYETKKSVQITATFHTWNYNSNGEETGVLKATGTVVCVEDLLDQVTKIKAYTIADDNTEEPNFEDDLKHTLAANDEGKTLYVQLSMDADDGDDFDVDNGYNSDYVGDFWFESNNENVLMIQEDTGELYPVSAGSAAIVVKFNDKEVGALAITVTGDRKLASVKLDTYKVVLSNGVTETKEIGLTVKDQYGDDYKAYNNNRSIVNADYTKRADDNESLDVEKLVDGTITVATLKNSTEDGTYVLKYVLDDDNSDVERTVTLTVDVKTPHSAVKYFAIETDKSSYDLKISSDDAKTYDALIPDVTVKVWGYDRNGLKNYDLYEDDPRAAGVEWSTVQKENDANKYDLFDDNPYPANVMPLADASGTISGDAIVKAPKGNYQMKANDLELDLDGKPGVEKYDVRSAAFKVVDTQKVPVLTISKRSSEEANVYDAIRDCINLKLDGKKIDDSDIIIRSGDITDTNERVLVKKVFYKELIESTTSDMYIYHEVKVDTTFRYNQ